MLPCHAGEPDLWFAGNPADLERAKELCGGCRCAVSALRPPWTGPNRGASGAGRSWPAVSCWPASVPADVRVSGHRRLSVKAQWPPGVRSL